MVLPGPCSALQGKLSVRLGAARLSACRVDREEGLGLGGEAKRARGRREVTRALAVVCACPSATCR